MKAINIIFTSTLLLGVSVGINQKSFLAQIMSLVQEDSDINSQPENPFIEQQHQLNTSEWFQYLQTQGSFYAPKTDGNDSDWEWFSVDDIDEHSVWEWSNHVNFDVFQSSDGETDILVEDENGYWTLTSEGNWFYKSFPPGDPNEVETYSMLYSTALNTVAPTQTNVDPYFA